MSPSKPTTSKIVLSFLLLAVLIAATAEYGLNLTARAAKRARSFGENHALIIGINDYKQWPKLKSPVSDAEAIAKVLTEKYNFKKSNIALLTDKTQTQPTLTNILTAFDKYVNDLTEKDNLLIFFSGQSTEDDEGDTYWIPIDGNKTTKLTWLKHTDVIEAYFGSENFKVKNFCILTDSLFSRKLVKKYTVPITFDNLRYEEKIAERASKQSREVIAFGEEHWPGDNKTNGLGLFTYYVHKALSENELDILDFENLILDEEILFPISKIAGARLLNGRLRAKTAQKGQFVIAKTVELPIVHVAAARVAPEKGYPGDSFTFTVQTEKPAFEVFVEFGGKKHAMKGRGKQWTYAAKLDEVGKIPFRVFATNENDIAGKEGKGDINVIKKMAEVANVLDAAVDPKQGKEGDKFQFKASTDKPAREVALLIDGKPFKMTGSGTQWTLTHAIDEAGTIEFSIAAMNEDGVQGAAKGGNLLIKAAPVNVLAIKTTPKTGYAGEEFLIAVNTDRPAKSVSLSMDGTDYPMEGSGKDWRFKKTIEEIGTKSFSVGAINVQGIAGTRKTGQIVTKKSPLPIPDVAAADIRIVSPGKGYAGDQWAIQVSTTAPSDKVFVEIEGERSPMQGSGTSWNYTAKIDKLGKNAYRIAAVNKDGAQGKTREGTITTLKRPSVTVNVAQATVNPAMGHSAKPFTFKVTTDRPAKQVMLFIGKTRYKMTGKDTQWELSQLIKDSGKLAYTVAAFNEDGKPGRPQKGDFTVYKQRFRPNADGTVTDLLTGKKAKRFADNGDGTVTDLLTSLMWLQTPKQIAVNYEEAAEYCKSLKVGDNTGWRLPTIGELNQLADKKRQNPALPAGHPFVNVITHVGYWSKTRHKFGPAYVYQMSMWYGKANHQKKDANAIVWPVRYAELPGG